MRSIKYIVIHTTATSQDTKISSIQNYWKTQLGWKSPGYHKIITADGAIHTLAPDTAICNGVANFNSNSLHVSYVGGIDAKGKPVDNRTEAQKLAMLKIVCEWKMKYPEAKVLGHRDFPNVAKACPCFNAIEWWACASGS